MTPATDDFSITYIRSFVRRAMPALKEACLQDGIYGADEFAKSLVSTINELKIFSQRKTANDDLFSTDRYDGFQEKTIIFPDEKHMQRAVREFRELNETLSEILNKKFDPALLPENTELPLTFSNAQSIRYEERDLSNPAELFDRFIQACEEVSIGSGAITVTFDLLPQPELVF